jgi:hypothetical protein
MIIKKIKLLVLFFILIPIYAFSFTLEIGENRAGMSTSTLKEIYNKYQTLPGFLFEKSEGKYFSLSKTGNAIGKFDLKDDQDVLSGWRVASPDTCESSNDNCEIPWWTGRWSDQEFLEPELKELFQYYSGDEVEIRGDSIGCLSKSPLRYGDIDEDSKNELLLFLNDNLLIFDPVLGKTVFLMLYNLDDYTSAEDTISQHGFEKPEFPQYVSSLKTNSGVAFQNDAQVTEPAFQAFAKLYTVDVNNDQIKDLLIWRKLFQSRLQSDVIKGFEKISDTYLHYKKVNGEYQLQTDTAPETIQGWLAANNQAWQSGFPSKSECAGQEGQLIPEMHDPLLNDPDVLK